MIRLFLQPRYASPTCIGVPQCLPCIPSYAKVKHDLKRLFTFSAAQDTQAAKHARKTIAASIQLLEQFPFTCRKAINDNTYLRELVVPCGGAAYVALSEIEDNETVTIIAIRHQREEDYH